MCCHLSGEKKVFSRCFTPLTGDHDWSLQRTVLDFKAGEPIKRGKKIKNEPMEFPVEKEYDVVISIFPNPDKIEINLVIDGRGTAWIEDIRLLKDISAFANFKSPLK